MTPLHASLRRRASATTPFLIALALATAVSPDVTAAQVEGPPVVVVGRVVDAETHRPLAAAQVYLPGTDRGALSDHDGMFTIVVPRASLPRGAVEVRAELIGFRSELTAAREVGPSEWSVDFRLHEQALVIDCWITGTPVRRAFPFRIVIPRRLPRLPRLPLGSSPVVGGSSP